MSTIVTASSPGITGAHPLRPSFVGIMRGEFIKISRMWLTWIMFVLLLGATALPYFFLVVTPREKDMLLNTPLKFMYQQMNISLAVTRIFVGFFLIILTAYVIGQEYQFGTVRILLARGLGRLQLLFAKVLTLVIIALVLFVFLTFVNGILTCGIVAYMAGSLQSLSTLTPAFWSNTWLYMLSVFVSMGTTILMATAASALCRSLALGLTLSVAFFAVDNIGQLFLLLAYRVTHSQFWLGVTAYVLGPNLNVMPQVLLPASVDPRSIGFPPFVPVDGPHTLWVALVYALIFAVIAIVLTWKRDVKE